MFVVVCYDVPDDRRRNRLAKVLLNYGKRVQMSVFECNLSRRELQDLHGEMERCIDPSRDEVLCLTLCKQDHRRIRADGGSLTEDQDFYVI